MSADVLIATLDLHGVIRLKFDSIYFDKLFLYMQLVSRLREYSGLEILIAANLIRLSFLIQLFSFKIWVCRKTVVVSTLCIYGLLKQRYRLFLIRRRFDIPKLELLIELITVQ